MHAGRASWPRCSSIRSSRWGGQFYFRCCPGHCGLQRLRTSGKPLALPRPATNLGFRPGFSWCLRHFARDLGASAWQEPAEAGRCRAPVAKASGRWPAVAPVGPEREMVRNLVRSSPVPPACDACSRPGIDSTNRPRWFRHVRLDLWAICIHQSTSSSFCR